MNFRLLPFICFSISIIVGCASIQATTPPNVPEALRVPADQVAYLEAPATGVQIYVCAIKSDSGYAWIFKAPEATLIDRSGKSLGKHYAGPTWEFNDGSTIVGEVKAKDPGPDSSAIPWLLLSVKSNSGSGVLSSAKSVQRVLTAGGLAPTEACTGANVNKVARVPYTATYYFYRAAL